MIKMNKKEYETLTQISLSDTLKIGSLLRNYLDTVEITEEPKSPRTDAQNAALHVLFRHIADELNKNGLSVQDVLAKAMEMDWTEYRVKEILWKNSQKKLYGKKSTTELKKTGEIDNVYEHINRFLAQGFVNNKTGETVYLEHVPFPSDEKKTEENMSGVKLAQHNNLSNENYPEYNGAPTI